MEHDKRTGPLDMLNTLATTVSPTSITRQIRKKVSQDRHRFQDDEYDLDLSYITNNVIAMGIPASGIQKLWRNSIDESAAMLKKYHDDHFMIWNLSGLSYDYEKFDNQIMDFGFPDHHSPPLEMLFKIVMSMHSYLKENDENVAVVHCVGGKGRTGTVVACYLIYSGVCRDTMEALRCFAEKRSSVGKGVIQASQIRYTKYFGDIITKRIVPNFRACYVLKYVELNPPPVFSAKKKGCRPVIQVFSSHHYPKKLLYSSDTNKDSIRWHYANDEVPVFWDLDCAIQSDILILVCKYQEGKKEPKKMFRFSFHCAFVKPGVLIVKQEDLDAQKAAKKFSKWFTPNFEMKLTLTEPSSTMRQQQEGRYTFDPEVNSYIANMEEELGMKNIEDRWGKVSDAVRNSMQLHPEKRVVNKETQSISEEKKEEKSDPGFGARVDRRRARHSFIGSSRQTMSGNRSSLPEGTKRETKDMPLSTSPEVNGTFEFDPEVEKKIKDRIGEQTIEDYDFLEDLARLIHQREEEKQRRMEQSQLKQQQLMRAGRKSKDPEGSARIVIGKFGMM